jgi:hypothetical protein
MQSGGDLLRPKVDEMLQPGPTHRPVQPKREWVEPLTEFFNSVCRASLERALRLHLGRHVDKPHLETCWDPLATRGEVGLHGRLASGYAEDAKTLHRPQGDVLRAAQLC